MKIGSNGKYVAHITGSNNDDFSIQTEVEYINSFLIECRVQEKKENKKTNNVIWILNSIMRAYHGSG